MKILLAYKNLAVQLTIDMFCIGVEFITGSLGREPVVQYFKEILVGQTCDLVVQ